MKRALAICVMLGLLGLGAWGAEFSGTWEGTLSLLPTLALEETSLTLTYSPFEAWSFTSTSTIGGGGFTDQLFQASGTLGAFQIEASLDFSPIDETLRDISYVIPDAWSGLGYDLTIFDSQWTLVGPHVKEAALDVSLQFAGISFGLGVSWQGNHIITVTAAGVVGEYLFYLDIPPYELGDDTWTLQPDPDLPPRLRGVAGNCYSKYFLTYRHRYVGLVATEVTFEVRDGNTRQLLFSHTVTGEFEVYYYNAGTGTVILTLGADTYLWQYFNNYLTTHNITFPGPYYMYYTIDPADVEVAFLFPSYMTYTLTAEADPFSAEIVFDDVCTGIQFKEATLTMSDVSLCCGITYDVELAFNKCPGFDHLTVSIADLFSLCCGISFDLEVEFGVDYKVVTLEPSIDLGAECLDLGLEVGFDGPNGATLDSITVDYIGVSCEYGDCLSLTTGTAFPVVGWSYSGGTFAPDITLTAPSDWGLEYDVVTINGVVIGYYEYEYFNLSFCGPACCGGQYTVDVSAYWADVFALAWDQRQAVVVITSMPTLFGLSRIGVSVEVPLIGDTLSITLDYSYSLITDTTTLDLGWSFRF